jgi:hypothetical protein
MKYHVFDHPTSFDRYTIIDQYGDMLSLSDNPTMPNGVNMFVGNCVDNYMSISYGVYWRKRLDEKKIVRRMMRVIIPQFEQDGSLGKPIKFSDLPELHQRIVRDRFSDESSTPPATDSPAV